MIACRLDSLPRHHRQPARLGEQFVMLAEDASRGAEHLELGLQPLGRREVAALIPERLVVALGGVIMEHAEIADTDILVQRTIVLEGVRARYESPLENMAVRAHTWIRVVYN